MKPPKTPVVIIGAGMAGLMAGLLVKRRDPQAEVTIVERSGQAGGNFRELDLPGFGQCDRAMRLIYETGIPQFDELLRGLLPEDEWHILPDNIKDIVGVYWRGALQTHSPYPDLRRLPTSEREQCEKEILTRLQAGNGSGESQDAANYLTHRFGPTAGACLTRVLEKFYGLPAAAMHESATCQPAMNRVVLYGEETLEPLLSNQKMRAVIAWPDQLTLPVKRDPPQSGFYPKRFGFNRVIDAAVHQLSTDGVRILFNRSVTSLERSGNHIISVTLDDGSTIQKPGLVVSANGLQASLALLRQPGEAPLRVPAPPRSWMVFLRINEPPQMGRLYHFWCFDEAFRTFRVTNYCGYCPDARTEAGYPLCVELWSSDEDAAQATRRAIQELRQMEVLNGAEITAQAALPGANMHALRTLETVQQLRALRTEVKERSPANMITVGPFIEDEVMLLYEVWRKMYPMIAERL